VIAYPIGGAVDSCHIAVRMQVHAAVDATQPMWGVDVFATFHLDQARRVRQFTSRKGVIIFAAGPSNFGENLG
jgi:hypothetical protein